MNHDHSSPEGYPDPLSDVRALIESLRVVPEESPGSKFEADLFHKAVERRQVLAGKAEDLLGRLEAANCALETAPRIRETLIDGLQKLLREGRTEAMFDLGRSLIEFSRELDQLGVDVQVICRYR